jgi:hypothetical protein
MDAIPSFAAAGRRVFMTATLAEDSVLVTHFDASPLTAKKPITPSRADDVGDRLILIPQELNPEVDDEALRKFAASAAKKHNVVVIVPSHKRAELWKTHAAQILDAQALQRGVERLRAGHVGLSVIVNRYDGIDLPNEACRILIIDGLPDVRSKIDRIEQSVLYGSGEQTATMVQKIEQGMGRGVRSNADYCVVLLMGRSLTRQLNTVNALNKFTPTTRAQFALSEKVSAQLRGRGVNELSSVIETVLKRDRGWVDASRGALVHVKYDPTGNVSSIAIAKRTAFNAARGRDYKTAIEAMQDVVNSESDARVKGWLRQQLATYTLFVNPVESQVILRTAFGENRLVTRPLDGIDYQRLRSVDRDQGPTAAEYLASSFQSGNHLAVEVYGLLEQLKFEPETSGAFERAVGTLARLIGFSSQRPEVEYGRGPDVLWGLGHLKYLVIEAKNGATTSTISKSDCNQLSGAMNWFEGAYDKSSSAVPIMIHPVNAADAASAPDPRTRVITREKLTELNTAIHAFAEEVAHGDWPPDAKLLGDLLTHHGLTASDFVSRFTTPIKERK